MPGRIVADSQGATQLNSRDSPLVSSTQIDCPEPYGQGQSGTVHNGTGSDRCLMTADTALEGITAMDGKYSRHPQTGQTKPSGNRSRNSSSLQASSVLYRTRNSLKLIAAAFAIMITPPCFLGSLSHKCCPIFRTVTRYGGSLTEKLNASFSYTLDQNTCI